MIEQVVKFGPELQFHPFLRQRDILEQGRVLVVGPGLAERVAGENAIKRSVHRNLAGEGRCVSDAHPTSGIINLVDRKIEKSVGRNVIRDQRADARGIAGEPWPRSFAAKVGHARVPNGEGLAGLIAEKSADLPAAEQIASLPFFRVPAQRDFPDPVSSDTMPHIEVGGSTVKTRMKGVKKTRPSISAGVQSAGASIVDRMAPAVVDTELCSP